MTSSVPAPAQYKHPPQVLGNAGSRSCYLNAMIARGHMLQGSVSADKPSTYSMQCSYRSIDVLHETACLLEANVATAFPFKVACWIKPKHVCAEHTPTILTVLLEDLQTLPKAYKYCTHGSAKVTFCCALSSCPLGVRLRAERKLKTDEVLRSFGGLLRVGNVRLGTLRHLQQVWHCNT